MKATAKGELNATIDTRESRVYRSFIVTVSLGIALGISAIFLGLAIRSRSLIQDGILDRGRSLFSSIVIARKWNAAHGGVFVEKTPGMESNPYLENPDIRTVDGRTFTMKNPALMTREISELSQREDLFFFHITSLRPLNPGNAPDSFEKSALQLFEKSAKREFWSQEQREGRSHFRYMAPLRVEKSCLRCHAVQGYREGDVRGGISVWFDISSSLSGMHRNFLGIFLLSLLTIVILILFIYIFFRQLRQKLRQTRALLDRMARVDFLTGIANRQHLMERFTEELARSRRTKKSLACIMLDVDHFKMINDEHGHLRGDTVLRQLALILRSLLRTYDVPGRYGGEEFLILLPVTDREGAAGLAERIRKAAADALAEKSGLPGGNPVTVSLGVTALRDDDDSIDTIIGRADAALYEAKAAGRNRVITLA